MAVADPARRYVAATGLVAALGTVWWLAHLTVGAGSETLAYTFVPIGAAIATGAVHHLCHRVDPEPAAARFWRTVRVALALITIGYAWLAVDMLTHAAEARTRAMPIPAAAFVGVGFALAIWAVARVPSVAAGGIGWWRVLLDRTIGFLGCAAALWYVGLAPMLSAEQPWSPQVMVLVGLAFVVAVGAATKVAHVAGGPVDPTAIRFIAASGGIPAGVLAVLAVRFGYAAGVPVQAVVMPLAPVMITLGVRAQSRVGAGRHRDAAGGGGVLLPYLAIAAADVPLIALAFGAPMRWPGRVVVIAAVVVTALVALRQLFAFRENAQLLRNTRVQEERLQYEASHDGLTGLANRALFRLRLAAALADTGKATVLLIDLDDFKSVNDLLGHGVGDGLLVTVARVLRDTVGDRGLAVRVGGDEFAVLLSPHADPEEVAGQLLDALSRPISEHRLLVQASIGIATAGPGATVDSMLRDADVAMYSAKQRGKASFVRYMEGMGEPVLAHMLLGGELRRALDNDELRVVYQPILRLDDYRLVGVEALVRWHHPTRGVVSPAEFIPAAERTGLIVALGRFVLRETCFQTARWLAEFGPDALREAGSNVSARQLHDPDFVSDVAAALADSGLPCDRLVLEVTESAVLRGQQVSQTLFELDRMGIRLALDDFGTGESSLSLLRAFPATILKLDKSFVDGIEIDDGQPAAASARQAVARAVIQLAHALNLDTIAEGVENAEQAVVLRELGYRLAQGYHLGRPMPAEGVSRMLASQQAAAGSGDVVQGAPGQR